jgi:hypothetical protein
MTAEQEIEMHELAEALENLTRGTGWPATRYMAIGDVMQKLATYCAVCDCQEKK